MSDDHIVHLKRKPPPTLEELNVQVLVLREFLEESSRKVSRLELRNQRLEERVARLERRSSGPHGGF